MSQQNECNICGKIMNNKNKIDQDCGGDCLECMALEGSDPDCLLTLVDILKKEKKEIIISRNIWIQENKKLKSKISELEEKASKYDDLCR